MSNLAVVAFQHREVALDRRSLAFHVFFMIAVCARTTSAEAQALPRWTAQEDLRIGSVDEPATALTPVSMLVVGADGRIYVRQTGDPPIRVFDDSGQPIGTIGRSGEAPGEFRSLTAVGWLADTLYVIDSSLARANFFTPDGEFLGSRALGRASGSRNVFPDQLVADGRGLAISRGNPRDPVGSWLYVERDGTMVDTLFSYSWPTTEPVMLGGIVIRPPPPLEVPTYAAATEGRALYLVNREPAESGGSAAHRIARIALTGDTIWSRSYPYQPIPVPPTESDSIIDEAVEVSAQAGRPASRSEVLAALTRARPELVTDFRVPVSASIVAFDGELWLRREEAPGAETVRWEVVDPAGPKLGYVDLPAGLNVLTIRADAIYGVVLGDFDVPYVVRYRVRRQDDN